MRLATVSLLAVLCGGMLVWAFTATVSIPTSTLAESTNSAIPSPHEDGGSGISAVIASRWDRLFARRFQGRSV